MGTVSNTDIELKQRKVAFDFSDSPLHWVPEEPFASHFISIIHAILPQGEFFFCRLYNKALPLIQDEKLREDVKGFIKQEAMHARAHDAGMKEFLEAKGIDIKNFLGFMEWLFTVALADQPFGRSLPKSMEKDWLIFRLGVISAVEHMTCFLGKYILENKSWDKANADEVILDMLRWHGAEEIEHRSVAFDVYQHLSGNYSMRYLHMGLVFPVLIGLWTTGSAAMMRQDSVFGRKKPKVFGWYFWREWGRVAKRGHLPSFSWLLRQSLDYFKPGYDPVTEASTEDAEAYLATSPAARRAEALMAEAA